VTIANRYTEKLSRGNCCAVFVDYLTGFLPGLRTMEPELFDHNVRGYTLSMRALGVPHCILGDEGGFRGEFFPVIKQEFAGAPTFERHAPSAWTAPAFREWVAGTGRRKVILGGISIDNCTSQTSFDLIANGYEVYVVVDASGAESELVERAAIHRLVQAGATPVNWVQIACEIMADWQTPEGPAIGRLLAQYSRYGALGVPHA
jgi:hypothetical protein